MSQRIVVAGTDTEIGKTVFSAGLADFSARSTGNRFRRVSKARPIPSSSRGWAGSPMIASCRSVTACKCRLRRIRPLRIDGVRIAVESLDVPDTGGRPLVIEGSGGLLVPLDRTTLYIDVFARWRLPVVLCARTALGTINHSLLSIEALRTSQARYFSGSPLSARAIPKANASFARSDGVRRLGRLPRLSPLHSGARCSAAFDRLVQPAMTSGP